MIIQVTDNKTKQDFHNTGRLIYKDDPNWTCPLDIEIEGIFTPDKNKSFLHGKAERWIVYNDKKTPIGRISAFYDKRKLEKWDQPTGGIGFFECIDDQSTANLLFDIAKNWLIDKGLEAMDGPINFGENFNHWGLLVNGFLPQSYGMQYHKPYYKSLFENYGFKVFFNQYSYEVSPKNFPERFWRIAERMVKNPSINCEHFQYSKGKKYINDLLNIYNETWATFKEDSTSLNYEDLETTLNEAKSIIDEELIWFVYKDNEPAAFFIMFPDVNQILRKLKGKLDFISKLKFLYYKKRNIISRTRVFVMGVKPKFQKMGLESAIFYQLKSVFEKNPHYKKIEMSWVGDYNPRMMRLFETTGAKHTKTHSTYRCLFDQNAEFKRFPIPDSKLHEKLEKK